MSDEGPRPAGSPEEVKSAPPPLSDIEDSARRLQERVDRFRATQKPPPPPPMSVSKALGFAMSMGMTLALALVAGYFLGNWLDQRLHSTMWVPIMVVAGLIAGPVLVYRMLRPLLD